MSVSPELIKSKLSSVDQTSDTIVSVSSWLLFHRRSAAVIVDTWLQAVRDGSSNRKLSLVYLANEVSQQSRAKKRPEYPAEFGRVMPEALENVFRHATTDVQSKITRVVDVWKQRSVFAEPVLAEINDKIGGKSKSATKTSSTPSAGVPSELTAVAGQYTKLFGATSSASLAVGTASGIYSNLFESQSSPAPSPDLFAAKLRQLEGALNLAKTTVEATLTVRKELMSQIQLLLERNTAAIDKEEQTLIEIAEKAASTQRAMQDNAQILANQAAQPERSTTPDMAPPTPEALTPPPADSTMNEVDVPSMHQTTNGAGPNGHDIDPVARLQMELDPSITALLARHAEAATPAVEALETNDDEEPYIP